MNDEMPGMSDDALRTLWDAEAVRVPSDRKGCPSPEELLDAVEGMPPGEAPGSAPGSGPGRPPGPDASGPDALAPDRERVLCHVASCAPCREDALLAGAIFAAVGGVQDVTDAAPGARKAEAPGPGGSGGGGVPRGRATLLRGWATAASVVLVAGGAGAVGWALWGGDDPVRGGGGALEAPQITCPTPGEVELQWAGVQGMPDARVVDYRVELFREDGSVVAERIVTGSEARVSLPGSAGVFVEGRPVQVRVEARMDDGRIIGSPSSPLPESCRPLP